LLFPLPTGFDLSSNPIQFKVLSARFYPHLLNHGNVVLFRETNPANSRQTPATALLSRRSEAKTDDVQQKTDLSRRNEMKADIAQDPALRDCWRIWTRSRHGVFTPWPASQNRLI
jgi:hypothetical protein